MQEIQGIKMAETTWPKIKEAFDQGWPVVMPLGAGCKEHGLHLPMNTDLLQAEYFADFLVKTHQILLAPPIQDNFFPAFVEYPGSSSLSLETSRNYIVELVRGWAKHGAKKFYVLNMGISTNKPLQAAKEELNKDGIVFEYLNLLSIDKDPRITAITKQKCGTHADEIETSIMMVIKPDVVHMEYAKAEEAEDHGKLTPDVTADPLQHTISATGAWGNPTLATPEKGQIAITVRKEALIRDITPLLHHDKREEFQTNVSPRALRMF